MNEEFKEEFTELVKALTAEQLDELAGILYPRHKYETTVKLWLEKRTPQYVIIEVEQK